MEGYMFDKKNMEYKPQYILDLLEDFNSNIGCKIEGKFMRIKWFNC